MKVLEVGYGFSVHSWRHEQGPLVEGDCWSKNLETAPQSFQIRKQCTSTQDECGIWRAKVGISVHILN